MFEHCESWRVVINLEDQYSIWPVSKAIPPGWTEEGKTGTKEECLSHIKEVWVDMRPRSLKKLMDQKNKKLEKPKKTEKPKKSKAA